MVHEEIPTRIRYLVVGLATAMAVLLYLDRICISFLERYIREELNLTNDEVGWLLGGFFVAYAVGQVPAGWLSDRFGSRAMLALYILLWSAFTGFMGLAAAFPLLFIFRFGFGLAQAGAYPTSAGIVGKWVPFAARARASSIIATGGRIGGFGAQVLTAYLLVAFVPASVSSLLGEEDLLDPRGFQEALKKPAETPAGRLAVMIRRALTAEDSTLVRGLNRLLHRRDLYDLVDTRDLSLPAEAHHLAAVPKYDLTEAQVERRNRLLVEAVFPDFIRKVHGRGWRPTLAVYGIAGVIVAGLFWLLVRDRPADHPRCNAAERALIEEGRLAASPHGQVGAIPWALMIRSGNLWLSSISQFGTNFGWAFLITWLPRYLAEVHRVPVVERGWLAGLPMLIGMSGMVAGGWLTDRLTGALGLRWGRRLPMAMTRFLAMAAFIACIFVASPFAATAAFCIVAIATDLGTASVWAFKQDIAGKHVGSVLGWGNMWGSVGAACSAVVLNRLIEDSGFGWNAAFVACALAFLLSGVTALGVDATVPIVPESHESTEERNLETK
jgi:MFS family permease